MEPYDVWQARIRPLELESERVFQELHPDCGGQTPLVQPRPVALRPLLPAAATAGEPGGPARIAGRRQRQLCRRRRAPPKVRRCGTCHQELGEGHVCRLEDLPKRLQAVVLAVAEAERGGG